MLKSNDLSKKSRPTGFARTFRLFDSRRLLGLKLIKRGGNFQGDVMVGGGLNDEYLSKRTQNILNIQKSLRIFF